MCITITIIGMKVYQRKTQSALQQKNIKKIDKKI